MTDSGKTSQDLRLTAIYTDNKARVPMHRKTRMSRFIQPKACGKSVVLVLGVDRGLCLWTPFIYSDDGLLRPNN